MGWPDIVRVYYYPSVTIDLICLQYGCHPNGSIVQTPSSHVYMLYAGQKRYVPSPLILNTWSDGSDIVPITQSEGAAYAEGSWVGFRPGKLIQDSSNSKVYFITNEGVDPWLRGNKRWITSPAVLNQCFPGRAIIGVDSGLANVHPTGSNITGCPPNPNGTVGYVPNVAVYMIHQNQKRWVISQAVQNSWFFGPDLVPLFCCPTQANNIGFRPGRLIQKASTSEVFFVTNEGDFGRATKRWITNPTTLNCLFPGEPIIPASDFEANNNPTGVPIQVSGC